jgi:hypothetical protein
MRFENPSVIYLLGLPYTGSTLFSVALGNSKDVLNLGEVSFLENDYGKGVVCLCGQILEDCQFWCRIKSILDDRQAYLPPESCFQLNDRERLSGPDQRHLPLMKRLRLILDVDSAFPNDVLQAYAYKNAVFFRAVAQATQGKISLDASKSPYRLQLLSRKTNLDLKVIWLRRDLKAVFHSKIKRVKRRSKRYRPFFSSVIFIGWLLNYYWACNRVYMQFLEEQRCVVNYQNFIHNPNDVQDVLSDFLETEIDFKINDKLQMVISEQHTYTGNQWLYKKGDREKIKIQKSEATNSDNDDKIEENIYDIFSYFIPLLRT